MTKIFNLLPCEAGNTAESICETFSQYGDGRMKQLRLMAQNSSGLNEMSTERYPGEVLS